jgi:hypothetical protein
MTLWLGKRHLKQITKSLRKIDLYLYSAGKPIKIRENTRELKAKYKLRQMHDVSAKLNLLLTELRSKLRPELQSKVMVALKLIKKKPQVW